jgi:phage shock protein E
VAAGQRLSVGEFATLAKTPAVVVLDVRTPDEFAAGHLPGAVDLDIRSADYTTRLTGLDKTTYAVYCHSGNRSADALGRMSAAWLHPRGPAGSPPGPGTAGRSSPGDAGRCAECVALG